MNIERGASFGKGDNIEIGDNSGIGINCEVPNNIIIGSNVMMGPDCIFSKTEPIALMINQNLCVNRGIISKRDV